MGRVQGHGGELDRVETYRGTTVKVGLAEKVRFEIAVSDPVVQPTIEALRAGAAPAIGCSLPDECEHAEAITLAIAADDLRAPCVAPSSLLEIARSGSERT